MSLRFRRRIKIIPGVHLNVSRSGISTSIGVRGASMTFGKRGTYTNVGVPGTGISWRNRVASPGNMQVAAGPTEAPKSDTPIIHHHLHWWKVALFFATMIVAGLTKSNAVIGFFWLTWFAYWGFIGVKLIIRLSQRSPS
ncbi:MAG TPA: DUF4236 domain-containing protein [Candidatus Kapabacteria bacterium]|jgi:hypothetical protein